MRPHEKQFWTLRTKNRMMIELIQEILASEDGEDVDWDSWDSRAKEALRANGVTIEELNAKQKRELRERNELLQKQAFDRKARLEAERHAQEFERAMIALASGGENSVYMRSLRRSAELRKQRNIVHA